MLTEIQLNKLRKENQEGIVDNCEKLFNDAEYKISEVVENTTSDFRSATNAAERMVGKNLLSSFVMTLVLLAAAIGGYLYVQNYKDGTKIAETKAVEALALERAKFDEEIEIAWMKLDDEIESKKKQIEQEAISEYKNSVLYREDACKLVASNISKVDYLHYMYIYIKSDDIKKYSEVKSFYNDFIKRGHEQYKRNEKK